MIKTYPFFRFFAIACLFQITICLASYAQCNGNPELCNLKYNEVVFLSTHNSYNSAQDEFNLPNHNLNIETQLNDGVRGLLIDVYELNNELVVYHTFDFLGSKPFIENLIDIRDFLLDNPTEIVTIIIECHTTSQLIETTLVEAGVFNHLYHHDEQAGWLTLQDMIDSNQRFVIFSEEDNGTPEQTWYHYVWDYTVETHYSVNHPNDFNCDDNRGDADNDLYLFNHFVTTELGVGDSISAAIINDYNFLYQRIEECQNIHNRIPNFVTVDFHELGNPIDVVNDLNSTLVSSTLIDNQKFKVYPNPVENILTIETESAQINQFSITNVLGQVVTNQINISQSTSSKITFDVSKLPKGFYFLKGKTISKKFVKK